MKITDVKITGLSGGTVDGGWPQGNKPEEDLNTLVEVLADEPARVTEKLRQSTFWQGRGGAVEHAISGIDIALWDLFGKITNQPVSRLLGGNYRNRIKPYGSLLFDEPDKLRWKLTQATSRGFKAIKLGWKPFGRRASRTDELLVQTARETV